MKIQIIEPDPQNRTFYQTTLESYADFTFINSYQQIKKKSTHHDPDLVISDLITPDGNILDILSKQKPDPSDRIPHLIVSGVDDLLEMRLAATMRIPYLVKPVAPNQLIYTIEQTISRCNNCPVAYLGRQDIRVDSTKRTLSNNDGRIIHLTNKEFQIAYLLLSAFNGEANRDALIRAVWGDIKVCSKTLDVHIFNLRKKLTTIDCQLFFLPPDRFSLQTPQSSNRGAYTRSTLSRNTLNA